MGHSSTEEKIHQLETRIERIERASKRSSGSWWQRLRTAYRQATEHEKARVAGWGILVITVISLLRGGATSIFTIALHIVALIISFWLLVYSLSIFELSDSMHHLRQQHRAHRAVVSHGVHIGTDVPRPQSRLFTDIQFTLLFFGGIVLLALLGWLSFSYIAQDTWRMVPFLILAIAVFIYPWQQRERWVQYLALAALYLIFIGMTAISGLSWLILVTCMIAILAVERRDWLLLAISAIGSYGSILFWLYRFTVPGQFPQLIPVLNWLSERQLIMLAALGFLALFTVPFIGKRREFEERGIVRLVLVAVSVGYLLTVSWLATYYDVYRWLVVLLSLATIMASFAYLSWLQFYRFSYAKYFLTIALTAFLAAVYLYLDPVSITLLWFVSSVIVLSVGFIMPSYSARWLGILTLSLTALQYLFAVLTQSHLYAGPVWLDEPVWVGVLISIYLPVLVSWYQQGSLRPRERELVPVLSNALLMLAWWILFALIFLETTSEAWQSGLWMVLGLIGVYAGHYFSSKVTLRMSSGLLVLAVIKLLLVDSALYGPAIRLGALFAFGLVLVIASLFLPSLSKKLIQI